MTFLSRQNCSQPTLVVGVIPTTPTKANPSTPLAKLIRMLSMARIQSTPPSTIAMVSGCFPVPQSVSMVSPLIDQATKLLLILAPLCALLMTTPSRQSTMLFRDPNTTIRNKVTSSLSIQRLTNSQTSHSLLGTL